MTYGYGYGSGWRSASYCLFCLAILFLIISLFFLFFAGDDKKHRRKRRDYSEESDDCHKGKGDKERNAFLALYVLIWAVALGVLAVASAYYYKHASMKHATKGGMGAMA